MANIKNIQLSEKIEFFLLLGDLSVSVKENCLTAMYVPLPRHANLFGSQILSTNGKVDTRVIDFFNEIMSRFGLYPLLQKYLDDKQKFKETYL